MTNLQVPSNHEPIILGNGSVNPVWYTWFLHLNKVVKDLANGTLTTMPETAARGQTPTVAPGPAGGAPSVWVTVQYKGSVKYFPLWG